MFFPASEKGNADSVIPKDMKRTEVVHKIESVPWRPDFNCLLGQFYSQSLCPLLQDSNCLNQNAPTGRKTVRVTNETIASSEEEKMQN